jgi:hypothetical protein
MYSLSDVMGILLLSFEFLSERRIKIAKTIQTFDAIKPEKWFKMLEIKTVIHMQIHLGCWICHERR